MKEIIIRGLDGECYKATTNKNAWLGHMGDNEPCQCGNTLFWNEYNEFRGDVPVSHQCTKCGKEFIF